jgi:RHS repeat-associated protein
MKVSSKWFIVTVVLLTGVAFAQVAPGTTPFGSFGGGPFDTVNLGSLNVHFAIPVLHKAGRGMPFTYDLSYDSSVWTPVTISGVKQWQPDSNWGWRGTTEAAFGYVLQTKTPASCQYFQNNRWNTDNYTIWTTLGYGDQFGVLHATHIMTENDTLGWCGDIISSGSQTTSDGYTLSVTNYSQVSVTSRSGSTFNVPVLRNGSSGTVTDPNGNELTQNTSGQFFDTLSSTTPVLTVSTPAPPSSTTFTYVAPSGGNAVYSMNYQQYTVQTHFGVSTVPVEYGPLSNSLVSSVTLPDGTRYTVTYEQTPSSCTPLSGTYSAYCVTGRIASVTLPTGGTITYGYTGVNHGIESDGSTAGLTRTLNPGGEWQYSRTLVAGTPGTGSKWSTTLIDPNNNYTVINAAEDGNTTLPTYNFYETQRQTYQGSVSTANLLQTSIRCYNAAYASCASAAVSSPITQTDVYSQLPNGSTRLSEVVYNSLSVLTDDKEYDYGVTMGSAPGNTKLVRETVTTFATLGSILDKPASVTVKDWSSGSAVTVASSSYNYDQSSVTTTTGTPQHTSVIGSRGNLTTTTTQTNSSTALYRKFTYYDTGMPNNSTSVDTSSSTTCASNPSICTTYNYSSVTASCGNAFPTSISEPLSLSRSLTWNCTGGVATQLTDESGNNVSSSYTDPYFWRPASVTDQMNSSTSFTYNGETSAESTLLFNSNHSVADSLMTVDGFGRSILSQRKQGPTATDYDSTETDYNGLGQPDRFTMPFQAGAGTTNSTAPSTSAGYDALGRVLTTVDGGGGTLSNTYPQNDVLSALTPIPASEFAKQTQTEYDGLGRVKSVCQIFHAGGGTTCTQATGSYSGVFDTYSYTSASYSTTVSVTRGSQTRSATFDPLGRTTSITTPEGGTTTYVYDSYPAGTCGGHTSAPGQLMLTTFANGSNICYVYDDLGRLRASEGWNSSTGTCSRYVYDSSSNGFFTAPGTIANAGGRLVEAETDACSPFPPTTASMITDEWFSYDKNGRITDEWQKSPHSTQYYHSVATFFENGAVKTLQLASPSLHTVTYGLDGEGRWNALTKDSTPLVTGATFYPAANPEVISLTGSPADNDSYTIDQNTGRMTKYVFNVGSISMTGNVYWNPSGTLKQLAITDGFNSGGTQTCNFNASLASYSGYDDLNRLTGVDCGSGQWGQTFSYDQYDNLTKTAILNRIGTTWNPTYSSSTNHYACSGCTTDPSGNVTNDSNHVFGWDGSGYNQLTWSATSGTPTCGTSGNCITYDAFGRIVETSIGAAWSERWYNQTGGWASMAGTSLGFVYWPAPAGGTVIVGGGGSLLYMHKDWLGSARLTSNLTTRLYTADTAYSPYGEMYDTFGATDTEFDEFADITGNYSNGVLWDARYRELSIVGRWLSPDPANSGWNQYAYPTNPNTFIDPLGLFHCAEISGGVPLSGEPCTTNGDIWFGGGGGDGGGGGGGGFSFTFEGGSICNSDFMPCGLPMPGLWESIWSDVLGLPSGLNCPQTGGILSPLCGGVSPAMDAIGLNLPPAMDLFSPMGLNDPYLVVSLCGKLRGFFNSCFYGCYGAAGEPPEVAFSIQHFSWGTIKETCPYLLNFNTCPTNVVSEYSIDSSSGVFLTKPRLLSCLP